MYVGIVLFKSIHNMHLDVVGIYLWINYNNNMYNIHLH